MILRGSKILFFILMLISIHFACERIEPVDYKGTGEGFVTIINPDVKNLSNTEFKYLGVLDEKHVFEILSEVHLPVVGDIFYYSDSHNRIFGKIETLINDANTLRVSISSVSLNEVFDFLSFSCDLSNLEPDSTYIDPRIKIDSDTLIFDPLEILWDRGNNIWGLLNLDSLKIYNEPAGNEQFFMGPFWENGVVTKRIDLEYILDSKLDVHIKVLGKGGFIVQDSMKIRERRIGPFFADAFPVDFIIEEWLYIRINSSGDNSFEAGIGSEGTLQIEAGYQQEKVWDFNSVLVNPKDVVREIIWNKKHSFFTSISLKTKLTPVFCGQPSLEIISSDDWTFNGNVDWPDWDYSIHKDYGTSLVSEQKLFSDLHLGNFIDQESSRLLEDGNGQLENNAPVPVFSVSSTSGNTETNFSFNAENSYDKEDESSLLEVRWDFNGDEIWDTNYSVTKQIDHIFQIPGNYTVVLEVKDSQGLTARLPKSVNVHAVSSAPTAYFTVSPESGRTSDPFYFDASGCWDSEDNVSQLKVRWDFNGDDIWDTQFSTKKLEIRGFPVPDTYVVKLEVKDTEGLTASTSRIIEVEAANIKPTAIFTVSPEEGDINTLFSFDASESSDVEDDASLLRVRWDFENDGVWDTEYRTIKTISHRFPTANSYTVLLEVIDTDNYPNYFSKTIKVSNPNTPPVVDYTISPTTGDTTTLFTFDARITVDLEDTIEELEFRWDWENDGIFDTEYSSSPIIEKVFESAGIKLIKLMVRDSGGLTGTKTRLMTVE